MKIPEGTYPKRQIDLEITQLLIDIAYERLHDMVQRKAWDEMKKCCPTSLALRRQDHPDWEVGIGGARNITTQERIRFGKTMKKFNVDFDSWVVTPDKDRRPTPIKVRIWILGSYERFLM